LLNFLKENKKPKDLKKKNKYIFEYKLSEENEIKKPLDNLKLANKLL
jgi:hypothetical protein